MIDLNATPPNDPAAEMAVLGATLMSKKALNEVAATLTPTDFYRPAHGKVWKAITNLHKQSRPVDPVAVADELARTGDLGVAGDRPYIHTLISTVIVATNVGYHAQIVKDLAMHRRLIDESLANVQDAMQSLDTVEAILARQETRLRKVPVNSEDFTSTVMSFDEFCDQPIPPNDWIIPNLLDRGDRFVLTGTEGLGKSILMRQFAVAVAAGIHPFTMQAIQPQTVLYVDVENPKKIMVKTFRELRDAVRRNRGPMDEKRLWVERMPAGLDLGDPKDRLALQRLVSLINPDLLCIGPAYKLYRGGAGDKDEDLARQVTSALDSIRESVNCALILEHHSGHGSDSQERSVRPFGSSLWLRWPEFGYGIRAAKNSRKEDRLVDVIGWRGPRDEREWPDQLTAGSNFFPWIDARFS